MRSPASPVRPSWAVICCLLAAGFLVAAPLSAGAAKSKHGHKAQKKSGGKKGKGKPHKNPARHLPPAELNFNKNKPYKGSVTVNGIRIPGLRGPKLRMPAGSLVADNGHFAIVTVHHGRVAISKVDDPGTYTGSVSLDPKRPEAKTKITLQVRDNTVIPSILLAIGLLIAFATEYWIGRVRPRGQVSVQLDLLSERLEKTAADVDTDITRLKPSSAPGPWLAPRITGDGGLLERSQARITEGLKQALSDGQRTRFGPDGDEMKTVDTLVGTYEGLLGYSSQIAQGYASLRAMLTSDEPAQLDSGLLADRVNEQLALKLIKTSAELTELEARAKDMLAVIVGVRRLAGAYHGLGRHGEHADAHELTPEQKKSLAILVEELLETVTTTDDLTAQQELYKGLAKEIYKLPAPPAPPAPPGLASILQWLSEQLLPGGPAGPGEEAPTIAIAPPPAPAQPVPVVIAPPPAPSPAPIVSSVPPKRDSLVRRMKLGAAAFTIISAVIVFGTGLAALWVPNATFGSFGDYLGVLLWASTVQGGLALIRSLLPGSLKSVGGSS
ncbi:MAG: hypothetical protein AABM43_10375 [Actinomycetota bacterium]